jgi:pimeloyl-ACP methyl ester carboxylesterase
MKWYDDEGCGPAILLIHGHPFNRSMWAPQIAALNPAHRIIAPDLRGYGDSPLRSNGLVTQEEFASDLAVLLDGLKIQRACIVGLSMGGQIAMEFGRRFPARVSGMVLAATSAEAETPAGVTQRNEMADRVLHEGMAVVGCEMLPKLIGRTSMLRSPELASSVYRMICQTAPESAAAAVRGRAARRDYRDALRDFHFPCLVIIGDEDGYTTLAQAESMSSLIPGSKLEVFPGTGHLPNLESREKFNSALLRFVETL